MIDLFSWKDFSMSEHGQVFANDAAAFANDKLAKALGSKVFSKLRDNSWTLSYDPNEDNMWAYLFDIKEIKKECKHDPFVNSRGELVMSLPLVCAKCGIKLKVTVEAIE